MKYFVKKEPLKKDGFYLTVQFMFGDADAFDTVSEFVNTEEELYNLYNLVAILVSYTGCKTSYDDIEWPALLKILGVTEEEFDEKLTVWLAIDQGFFLGHAQEIVLSMIENGVEYELVVKS